MSKFGVSQSVRRKEDQRFLTGEGQFLDDLAPEGALFCHFLRSPVAHGRITALDVEDARAMPGVRAIFLAGDLTAAGVTNRMPAIVVDNGDGTKGFETDRPLLAGDHVCHLGEAVAMIVADSPAQARDAAEAIWLEIEDLPVSLSMNGNGPQIHDHVPGNIGFDWRRGDPAATEAAFAAAAHVVRLEVIDNRIFAASLEPRGALAEWRDDRLHLTLSGQGVWIPKAQAAAILGLAESAVHVINPDVGGGFGMKAFTYPEYFVVAHAARVLGASVRWMSDRAEAMLSDNGGRDLVSLAELAFDEDLKLLGYRVTTDCNLGAYNSFFAQNIQTELAFKVLTGTYDIAAADFRVRGHFTNTTPVDAFRGAGRPEAIYVLERAMDRAARELGVTGSELRRRNFIRPDQFPYTNVAGETYDVGAFAHVLDRAERAVDMAGFASRRARSKAEGRLRGIGLCYYIEAILGQPSETTKLSFNDTGGVDLFVGTQSNGQGHETVFAQILHDRTGIPFEAINFVQGDSDLIAQGGGTGGSRSVTTQGVSINATADRMIEAFAPFVADELDVTDAELEFSDGNFHVKGSNRFLSLMDAAEAARAAGRQDLLTAEVTTMLPGRSFPNGAHFAEVEVDPETGRVVLARYVVVDDFGVLMNPMLAEGQVHGGVAQGVGQALLEQVAFDADGQLLSGSLMDYALPRADDLPFFEFHHEGIPSTANPIGMKGCGEAGTIGALAAVANAVADALWEEGVRQADMPFTPHRVWQMLMQARQGGGSAARA